MGQEEGLDNAIALSEETIHLILQDFGRYREPIPQAVVKYLVDGGDDGILQQLQGHNTRTLNEYNSFDRYPSYSLRCQILHTLTTQDIEFYHRLTRTYAVEAENLHWLHPLSPDWLSIFPLDWLSLFLFFLVELKQLNVTFTLALFCHYGKSIISKNC